MEYAIFGAGDIGKKAFFDLGADRVGLFIDNFKKDESVFGKRVVTFDEFILEEHKMYMVVIATILYENEMKKQLEKFNIYRYFIYSEKDIYIMKKNLPTYEIYRKLHIMQYDEVLANYEVEKNNHLAIYGVNESIAYLISEIGFQNKIENIVAIIDDKCQLNTIMGIPVIKSVAEIEAQIDCLIINKRRTETMIRDEVEKHREFSIVDLFDVEKFVKIFHNTDLVKYKNIYKGKRLFIIGNGPSMTTDDLEKLHKFGEITFGLNRIYRIYNEINWRPNYLVMSDVNVICEKEIENIEGTIILADLYHRCELLHMNNVEYIHMNYEEYYPNYPNFSSDITKQVYCGYTVTFDIAIQMAAYMGASEIYLVGIDHTYLRKVTDQCNHFIKNYFDNEDKERYKNIITELNKSEKAYKKAELYSRNNGFRIYNATRGGKLEVFERVDFDSLFK